MKPSEFIKLKLNLDENKPNVLTGQYTILAQYIKDKDFKELDLRFIDKEELKEKINKLNYSLDVRGEMPYKRKCYLEEILKLLE